MGLAVAPLYVCVHVPQFPAQALLRLRPELVQTPVAVLAGTAPLQQVCSLNAQAKRLGVAPGMTRAQLEPFAGLTLLPQSDTEERIARQVLLQTAAIFTPRAEVQAASSSTFVLVLDMTGSGRIFGPAAQVAATVARAFSALQVQATLAASANLHTAVCVAPFAGKQPVLIAAGQEHRSLAPLPLAALPLTPVQAETFALWGIATLGELAAIPEVDLIVRLGQQGKRLRLFARGEHPHHMVPEEPVFALEEYLAFDAPLELLDSLLFVFGPMLDQLLARAQNHALALAAVTVRLGLEGGGTHERTVKPAMPVVEREVLLKLLHLDLQAHPPPAGILSVLIHGEPGDRSKVQLGLFAPQLPESLRLDVTLARIAAIVGEERVGRARLLDAHRPDSFAMERFTVPPAAPATVALPPSITALRRCRPPVPLAVRHRGPELAAFTYRGRQYRVQQAYGPWRRSGQWWSGEVWSREEWDVHASVHAPIHVSDTGEDPLFCIVSHDLLRQQWHMEALYD